MNTEKYDIVCYIGRFQCFTMNGHLNVLTEALSRGDKVAMLLGSANQNRSFKNPFTYFERCKMIRLTTDNNPRIMFAPINDHKMDEDWISEVKCRVKDLCVTNGKSYDESKIALIGMDKDESSYYLKYFPFWDYITYEKPENVVSATDVRNLYFNDDIDYSKISEYVTPEVVNFLKDFKDNGEYNYIMNLMGDQK